jgi:hypothetical protein
MLIPLPPLLCGPIVCWPLHAIMPSNKAPASTGRIVLSSMIPLPRSRSRSSAVAFACLTLVTR